MKKIVFGILALITITVSLQSCNEDIELIGDFEETAVVYGLLDQSDSLHMIKITRAFIGPGNSLEIAQIPDSSYFNSLTGTVTEFLNGNPTGRVFTLSDTLVDNKDENGVFYAPQQKLYYFETLPSQPLLGNAEYQLDLDINNGDFQVSSKTAMVSGITNDFDGSNDKFSFYSSSSNSYSTDVLSINNTGTAHQINIRMQVEFIEWEGLAQTVRSFEWNLGENEVVPGSSETFVAPGQTFYQLVANNCSSNPAVTRRTFGAITTTITGGSEELVNYIQVNAPSTSLAQNKPTYTNLTATNGHPVVGIFTSRSTTTVYKPFIFAPTNNFDRAIDNQSTDQLCTGPITGPYLFCSNHPGDALKTYYCP
jgi:hypothetical protein